MNPDKSLKEKAKHGTERNPITGLHFSNGRDTACPEHFFVDRHWHPQVEILYFIKGSFEVEINFNKSIYHEGDICILNSEDLHQIKGISEHTIHEAVLFDNHILDFSYMDEFETECLHPLQNHSFLFPHSIRKEDEVYPLVIPCVRNLTETAIKKENGWYITSKLALLTLISMLFNNKKLIPTNTKQTSLHERNVNYYKTVVSYMEQHLEDHVTLQDLSAAVPCNSQYLCRLFKEVSGFSPIQYFISLRIKKACNLLKYTSDGILQIALECGFENVSYFTRTFKKQMDCTPREYRKRYSLE